MIRSTFKTMNILYSLIKSYIRGSEFMCYPLISFDSPLIPTIIDIYSTLTMAIIELIFPRVKPDHATLETLEKDWPTLSKGLTHPNPGLLHTFRGWVLTEDGKDVREEYHEFLLFGEFTYWLTLEISHTVQNGTQRTHSMTSSGLSNMRHSLAQSGIC